MKKFYYFISAILFSGLISCSDNNADTIIDDNGKDEELTDGKYPAGSIVWKKDTVIILKDHFLVNKDQSLYIEEGASIIASNSDLKPEIVVLGNLYSMGTAKRPVTFTVEDASKNDRFSRHWGGIICGFDSKEVVMQHTVIEYGGAQTTENSLSFQHKLFKTETGEGVPAFHFCNPEGQFVIKNSVFRNNAEDHIYITGGKSIVENNKFITNGFDGGEAINYKSDCLADIAFNLIYDANTNAFKFSNGGFVNLQSHLVCYNNTLVNCGWRRPKIKGGSIWLEKNVFVELFNNLAIDSRWGLKHSIEEMEDESSVVTPNFYYSTTQTGVEQMAANSAQGIINGKDDIYSAFGGDKNPLFANFTQQENININVSANEGDIPALYNDAWSFAVKQGSPVFNGATTSLNPHFSANGLHFEGLKNLGGSEFKSSLPANYFGAFGI